MGLGEAVNVGVTVNVIDAVAVSVGGRGVDVIVGVAVGAANNPVPHPDNKIDIPKNKAIIFFIRFLLIEFPDKPQSIQREPWRDVIDHLRFFCDDFSHAAGCDDFHIASKL